MNKKSVTVIAGDGIGPEITRATLQVLEALKVPLEWELCEAGEKVFASGDPTGVPKETRNSIERTRVVLKGPLATPIGHGASSANVTLRNLFELFANIRPAFEIPGIKTPFSGRGINLVVVRENVEDLYSGIEHLQTPNIAQCLKLISRGGCEKVVRVAFEIAASEGRKTIHCGTKANIMKLSEGELKRTFERIAPSYPELTAKHIIIDNLAHQLVINPEQFEVLVMTNMNGDIISDLTSGLVGGLGLTASMNFGRDIAMFEAVHGTAPDIAGKGLANPTALLFSAELMLRYIGMPAAASTLKNAIMRTYEEGQVRTGDLKTPGAKLVGTMELAEAIIKNFNKAPSSPYVAKESQPLKGPPALLQEIRAKVENRRDIGVDIFVESTASPAEVGRSLEELTIGNALRLKMVSNRGTQGYPTPGGDLREFVDLHRARFVVKEGGEMSGQQMLDLMGIVMKKFRIAHTETLLEIDGKPGYSLAQGEK